MDNDHSHDISGTRESISTGIDVEEEFARASFVAMMIVGANRPVDAFQVFREAFAAAGSDKSGILPASKESIDAMPRILVTHQDHVKDCTICLDEIGIGGEIREMPCTHGFHSSCIEKWLNIHGSCPVCRFVMPAVQQDQPDDDAGHDDDDGGSRERDWS